MGEPIFYLSIDRSIYLDVGLQLGIGGCLSPQMEPCACKLQDLGKAQEREQWRRDEVQESQLVAFEGLVCTRHCTWLSARAIPSNPIQPYKVVIISCILQMKKVGLRESKEPSRGYTCDGEARVLNSGLDDSRIQAYSHSATIVLYRGVAPTFLFCDTYDRGSHRDMLLYEHW